MNAQTMKSLPKILVPIFLVLVAAACGGQPGSAGEDPSLTGRFYELQVTHTLNGAGSFANGQWSERDFDPVEDGCRYLLNLSTDGGAFELQSLTDERSYSGHAEATRSMPTDISADDCLCYSIDEGSFAGGRLVIWRATTGLRAELTIFGSGLPFIGSDRGDLREMAV
jgi:hypothetical protein